MLRGSLPSACAVIKGALNGHTCDLWAKIHAHRSRYVDKHTRPVPPLPVALKAPRLMTISHCRGAEQRPCTAGQISRQHTPRPCICFLHGRACLPPGSSLKRCGTGQRGSGNQPEHSRTGCPRLIAADLDQSIGLYAQPMWKAHHRRRPLRTEYDDYKPDLISVASSTMKIDVLTGQHRPARRRERTNGNWRSDFAYQLAFTSSPPKSPRSTTVPSRFGTTIG